MNDIEEAFGVTDDQPEVVETSTREQGLTELHQTKADALATVRPMRELTVEKHGIKKVIEGRKAVVKLRTSVDKRRKSLNEEAKKWIDTVNGTAKEILSIIEPVELHLKGQEALHEERQRQAEEAERLERVAVRRGAWPADAGEFPEAEAGTLAAVDWQTFVFGRMRSESERRKEAERQAAERAELEEFRRAKAEAERQARQTAERETLARQHAEERAAFEKAEAEATAKFEKRAKLWDESPVVEPPSEPVILPVSEGVGRMADDLRQGWSVQSEKQLGGIWEMRTPKPSRNAESRLLDLVQSVKEIILMRGDVDWRGLLSEALEDAAE